MYPDSSVLSLSRLSLSGVQVRYKEGCKKDHNSSVFSTMPETTETQLAKELQGLYSQVRPPASPNTLWIGDQLASHQRCKHQ